jgi:hypothetical protein
MHPAIVSDSAGGAIVTWYDYSSGSNYDIYAQRVNALGTVQWTPNGVALCTAKGDQSDPAIVSDGAGGAIVTWWDYRTGSNLNVYGQRVNASGAVQWTADGVDLSTAAGDQGLPRIVSDAAGGAIVTWMDKRSLSDFAIYAQRVNALGAVQWTTDGVALCTATATQPYFTITSDGASGAIVTWMDHRTGNTCLYAQRVDASGAVLWTANGVALSTGLKGLPAITSDGAGGAIVAWADKRTGTNWKIYGLRIGPNGSCALNRN